MACLDCQGAGQQQVPGCIGNGLGIPGVDTGIHPGGKAHGVDLVEGQPVFDLAAVLGEAGLGIPLEAGDGPPVRPGIPGIGQAQRGLIVAEGHQGLDAVFMQLVEHIVVKLHTRCIGFLFQARGVQAAPVDGEPEGLEAHFTEEGDVLFVVVVEVDALVAGVVIALEAAEGASLRGIQAEHEVRMDFAVGGLVSHLPGTFLGAPGADIGRGRPLAACVPAALKLVGGSGTAPEKVFRKSHMYTP